MKQLLLILSVFLIFSCSTDEQSLIAYIGIVELTPNNQTTLHEKTTITCVIEYDIPEVIAPANGFVVFLNIRDKSKMSMDPAPIYPLPDRHGVFTINIPMGPDELTEEKEFVFDVVLNRYDYGAYTWLAASKSYTYKFTPAPEN